MKQQLDADREKDFLNDCVDRASESAAYILSLAGESGIEGVRDLAVDMFYETLAAGLGMRGETPALTRLRLYVPVIAVTDGMTAYICYDRFEEDKAGRNVLIRGWSEAIDSGSEVLSEQLEYFCNEHNAVAGRAGIKYRFELPDSEGGLFARGSGGTGFYVLFQGYPMERISVGTINCFSFAGTGVKDAEQFFINLSGSGYASERYYHRKGCEYLSGESIMFGSGKDCALNGAYECPECMGGY